MKNLFAIVIIIACIDIHVSHAQKTLTIGVVPQQSARKLAKLWTPILKEISNQSGVRIRFKTAKDIPTFEKKVLKGVYDLAYMNPYHYIVFHKKPGYIAFAKRKNKKIHGIIVVSKSNNIKSIKELNGKTLVFPSPAAFAASILPRAFFKKQKIQIKSKYVSSHDSVYRNVEKGLAIAGGGIVRTLKGLNVKIKNNLRVLWKSPGYTPHAFAYHPRLSKQIITKISTAFLGLNNNQKGRALLKNLKFTGIAAAKNREWDDIRSLNIQNLEGSNLKK